MNLTIDHRNQLLTSQCNHEILIAEINQDGLNVSIIVYNWQVLICDKCMTIHPARLHVGWQRPSIEKGQGVHSEHS